MDTLISQGGAIKALGDGKIGGYGVIYGGKDLTEEGFTPDTYYGAHKGDGVDCLFHHSLPIKGIPSELTDHIFPAVKATPQELGIFVETVLNMADEYEAKVYELVQSGKLGWSSGAPAHAVRKNADGIITRWPIAEFSLTPEPAEPRTRFTSLKALMEAQETPGQSESQDSTEGEDEDPAVKYISKAERDKIPADSFAGPNRTFPIRNQEDVDNAARLIGHASNPGKVKQRIIAIAKRKGLKLPDAWTKSLSDWSTTFAAIKAEYLGDMLETDCAVTALSRLNDALMSRIYSILYGYEMNEADEPSVDEQVASLKPCFQEYCDTALNMISALLNCGEAMEEDEMKSYLRRFNASKAASIVSPRLFEGFLRDAGFSRKDATAITSHGFKSLQRDAAETVQSQTVPTTSPADVSPHLDDRLKELSLWHSISLSR